ncbi:hypothetical protein DYH09_32980 [bacterium CPR1]|nr:hypothetical protein [bacterium CPR1]
MHAALVLILAGALAAEVATVRQLPNHCGVASAETVARLLGLELAGLDQRSLALCHNARIPEFAARTGDRPQEQVYPAYLETHQALLAEILIDRGLRVLSFRESLDSSAHVLPQVFDCTLKELRAGHPAVFHVPGHYMVFERLAGREIVFRDPARPEEAFRVPLKMLTDSQRSFHSKPNGQTRPGWDGRVLFFWKGRPNRADQCPVCHQSTPGRTFRYCRTCRVLVDRRRGDVGRALDALALSCQDFHQTALSRSEVTRAAASARCGLKLSEQDWRQALIHYPLHGPKGGATVTLNRLAQQGKLSLDDLSTSKLEEIVSSAERWADRL